jgi:hypothetical protein
LAWSVTAALAALTLLAPACGGRRNTYWLATGGAAGAFDGSGGDGDCVDGEEHCPCYPNQTCNGSLVCEGNLCRARDGSGAASQGGGANEGGSAGSGGSGGSSAGDGDSSGGFGGSAAGQGGTDSGFGGNAAGQGGSAGGNGGAAGSANGGSATSGNLIVNGDFSQGDAHWEYYPPSGTYTYAVVSGRLCVTLGSYGYVVVGWPLEKNLAVPLAAGASYTLSYTVSATQPGEVSLMTKVGHAESPYTAVIETPVSLSTTPETRTHTFSSTSGDSGAGIAFTLQATYYSSANQICFDDVALALAN